MDIGASYRGYAADVTRTVPVSGTFSPEQRAIYQIVRDAQHAAETRCARSASHARHGRGRRTGRCSAGLARLGLIESANAVYDPEARGCRRRVRDGCSQLSLYYFHALGHGDRPRGARSHVTFVASAGQHVHDRAGHLRAADDARRAPRHAAQSADDRDAATGGAALREHRRAHRGRLFRDRQRRRMDLARRRARPTRSSSLNARIARPCPRHATPPWSDWYRQTAPRAPRRDPALTRWCRAGSPLRMRSALAEAPGSGATRAPRAR